MNERLVQRRRRMADLRKSAMADGPARATEAPVRRSKGEPATVTLEADHATPTGPQAAAIADALRTLAAWAVRVARRGEETAPTPGPAANNPLDFPRTSRPTMTCQAAAYSGEVACRDRSQ